MAVDTNGDVIVADYDNRWISIFSPDGKFKVMFRSQFTAYMCVYITAQKFGIIKMFVKEESYFFF